MFSLFEGKIYILNHAIFFVALALFFLKGLNGANRIFQERKQDKKEYLTVLLLYPSDFLISFFIIDAAPAIINAYAKYSLPYSLLIYWLTVILAGILLSVFTSLYIGNEYRNTKNRGE